jgi:hypothetical protein
VPILGAIPFAGRLFRNKTESTDRTELIVLITPRIVREPDAEIEGESFRVENERRTEYFRNHLAQINRRNLARSHYERAYELYERGDLLRAREQVDHALRHSKNDMDALRLRDQIELAIRERAGRWMKWPRNGEQTVEQGGGASSTESSGNDSIGPQYLPPVPAPPVD